MAATTLGAGVSLLVKPFRRDTADVSQDFQFPPRRRRLHALHVNRVSSRIGVIQNETPISIAPDMVVPGAVFFLGETTFPRLTLWCWHVGNPAQHCFRHLPGHATIVQRFPDGTRFSHQF